MTLLGRQAFLDYFGTRLGFDMDASAGNDKDSPRRHILAERNPDVDSRGCCYLFTDAEKMFMLVCLEEVEE